jgi:hypothetical protein
MYQNTGQGPKCDIEKNILGNKFQASRIIVHILTPIGTKAHTTSDTSVIGRETTYSTKVATGG